LRERAGTSAKLGGHGCVLLDPVGESVLTILDDGLAGLVSIICFPSLTRGNRGVINQLEQMLAVTRDDSKLLAVLTKSLELVCECCLEFLTGDIGQLSLGNERFGLSADKFLLEDDDSRAVGFLIFELCNLVGDLLLA